MENPKNKIWQYLLGKPALDVDSVDLSGVDTTSPEFKENAPVDIKVGNNPRVGGLLPDIAAGYRENSARPMEFSNLQANITPDGREKGGAYRFGEFAGTAARLLDNPLVRGAITYGLSKNMGDKNPLNEALSATVGTQQNKMKDTMYRQALAERGIDTSGIRGWLGDDTFKYLLEDQQVRDNAAYRNAYLESQKTNQAIANQIALDKLNYTKLQDAKELALGWAKLKADKEKRGTATFSEISSMRKEFSGIPAIKNYNEIKRQVGNVTNTYNAYKSGKLKANAADQTMVTTLNKILDPTSVVRESEFARTAAGQSLLARIEGYANKMTKGGGGLTDAEREDLYNAMMEMYRANEEEANAYIQSYTDLANRYGINPADIMPRQYYQSNQTQSTTNNDPLGIRG